MACNPYPRVHKNTAGSKVITDLTLVNMIYKLLDPELQTPWTLLLLWQIRFRGGWYANITSSNIERQPLLSFPLLLESDSKQSKSADDMSMHCLVRLTWRFIRALRTKVEGICSLCQCCVCRNKLSNSTICPSARFHTTLQTSSFSLEYHKGVFVFE